jgi:tetratricopeptide (TPR) repeat protein
MKSRIAALCVCFVLGITPSLFAQEQAAESNEDAAPAKIAAGSPEDRAFMAIKRAATPEAKIPLLLDFEKQYPKSPAMSTVYTTLLGIYLQQSDNAKMIEYGEKAIKVDAKNMTALLALSRGYALSEKPDIEKAKAFAERATKVLAELRTKPPQPGYSDSEWKDWLKQNDESVGPWAEYVKAL